MTEIQRQKLLRVLKNLDSGAIEAEWARREILYCLNMMAPHQLFIFVELATKEPPE